MKNVAAFEAAHSAGLPIAGIFAADSGLSNGGESVKLEDADGGTIQEFTYNDKAPWPTSPDTAGNSLVLISPESNTSPSEAANWRASFVVGGTPGEADTNSFVGIPNVDADGDGLSALLEFAAGTSDTEATGAVTSVGVAQTGGIPYPTFTYRLDPTAGGIQLKIESSTDLIMWQDATSSFTETAIANEADGALRKTFQSSSPISNDVRKFYRLKVELN